MNTSVRCAHRPPPGAASAWQGRHHPRPGSVRLAMRARDPHNVRHAPSIPGRRGAAIAISAERRRPSARARTPGRRCLTITTPVTPPGTVRAAQGSAVTAQEPSGRIGWCGGLAHDRQPSPINPSAALPWCKGYPDGLPGQASTVGHPPQLHTYGVSLRSPCEQLGENIGHIRVAQHPHGEQLFRSAKRPHGIILVSPDAGQRPAIVHPVGGPTLAAWMLGRIQVFPNGGRPFVVFDL